MIPEKELFEIREHLSKAHNPVFFFDNDCDGLISFILLKRLIERGKGVAIKSFPGVDVSYIKKVDEFNADYIFVLDKPYISEEFIREAEFRKINIVWIDHHEIEGVVKSDFLHYYNPLKFNFNVPTSYISYLVSQREQDRWLCLIGCVADFYLPDFYPSVHTNYPELLLKKVNSPFEIYYSSEFGKLVDIVDFSLKDKTSSVVNFLNFISKAKSPYDLLKEDKSNLSFLTHYSKIKKSYDKIISKAKSIARNSNKFIFFKYAGDLSMSSNIANELSFRFPGKVIIVAYIKGGIANLSIRGEPVDVRELTLKAISKIPGAIGGGHKYATGAKISVSELDNFRSYFEKHLK
jgi:single-stranded DNA-specific DHH superfamily exonuclease